MTLIPNLEIPASAIAHSITLQHVMNKVIVATRVVIIHSHTQVALTDFILPTLVFLQKQRPFSFDG